MINYLVAIADLPQDNTPRPCRAARDHDAIVPALCGLFRHMRAGSIYQISTYGVAPVQEKRCPRRTKQPVFHLPARAAAPPITRPPTADAGLNVHAIVAGQHSQPAVEALPHGAELPFVIMTVELPENETGIGAGVLA